MSGAASEWRPIALTAKIYREGDQYVAHCVELDIASCGDTEEEAFENLVDASDVYVATLEETGQIERVFAERGCLGRSGSFNPDALKKEGKSSI